MVRSLALLLALAPLPLFAATLQADDTLDVSVSPADNAYYAGTEVHVIAPLPDDLIAAAGSLEVAGAVGGDALIAGGTILVSSPVAGDVRALGGRVDIQGVVGGELAIFGADVSVSGRASEVQVAGASVSLSGGAAGPVTVYGANVSLAGVFDGDVRVVASDRVTLAEGTVIRGAFEYNAPAQAAIPASAMVEGGVSYIGSSSFLPTAQQAQTFALAGVGVLFLVRLVAGAAAAGLLVGLFPQLASRISARSFKDAGSFMRMFLIGFAAFFAIPVAVVLLLASFVGIGIAAVIGAAYLLLLLLSYLYAAALAGALLMRLARKRFLVSWKSAIFGMVLLYLMGLVPGLGFLAGFVLSAAALGALLTETYLFAWKREVL